MFELTSMFYLTYIPWEKYRSWVTLFQHFVFSDLSIYLSCFFILSIEYLLFWCHVRILKPHGRCFHFFVTKTPILSLLAGDDPPICSAQKLILPFSLKFRNHRFKTLEPRSVYHLRTYRQKDIFKMGNFDIMSIGNTQEDTELKWPQLLVGMGRYSRFSDYFGSEPSLVQNSPFAGEMKNLL